MTVDAGCELRRVAIGLAGCALGGALAILLAVARGGEEPSTPGRVQVWVSDRDGQALIGLDRDLLVAARVEVPWPTEIEACEGGGVWAVSAREGDPLGAHDLLRLLPDGGLGAPIEVGPVIHLATVGVDALVTEREEDGATRVRRFAPDGMASLVAELPDALCASGVGERVIVGTARGAVLAFGRGAPAGSQLGGAICDVAPGPSAGAWWVLERKHGGPGRLLLLDAELRTLWSVSCELEASHLAPVAGQERIWLVDAARPLACRFGPGGVLELACGPLPQAGLGRAAALDDGGLLVAAPGALLHLDARGRLVPGQGGFDFLTDVAR